MGYLQCAIPVFDGLLPEPHNSAVLRLLFVCAHWHGLAKLRMHTDQTLDIMDDVTTEIGAKFRAFSNKTCSAFDTQELPRESAARKRRRLKKAKGDQASAAPELPTELDGPLAKKFSLQTYKYHALGDHAKTIRRYGTSDSTSTEPVSNLCYVKMICANLVIKLRGNLSTVPQRRGTSARIKETS
jgi:hypothetical protein